MRDGFKNQFKRLNDHIGNNVDSLKGLVIQSEELSKLIDGIKKDKNVSSKTSESLENIRDGIHKSIGDLIVRTEELFKTYDAMVDEVLEK